MELYPGLIECVRDEILKGTPTKVIYQKAIKNYQYSSSIQAFYKYVAHVKRKYINDDVNLSENDKQTIDERFIRILEKRKTIRGEEICDELSCSPEEIYGLITSFRSQGYEILVDNEKIILSSTVASEGEKIEEPLETNEIIFGVMSDLHFGSKMCQITAMNQFAEIARKKGVKHILCPGDIFAGYNVYPGQMMEVYAVSSEEQEESAAVNLPTGFEYYMLGGNHDYSFIKRGGGHNPLLALETLRNDVHYIGFDEADVPILEGVTAKLVHPSGGVPYSASYRIQKFSDEIIRGEYAKVSYNNDKLPTTRFILAGHLHIQLQMMLGSIFGAQCGCFEGKTNYLRGKGLSPLVGGYIISASLRKHDGILLSFSAKFYMFPDYIEKDWQNYKHTINGSSKQRSPIFI